MARAFKRRGVPRTGGSSSSLEGRGKGRRVSVASLLHPPRGELVVGAIDLPVPIRGQWIRDHRYADLRNAAWFVRNYRLVAHDDSLAMAKLCYAVRLLLDAGEPLEAVVPSLADLFLRP